MVQRFLIFGLLGIIVGMTFIVKEISDTSAEALELKDTEIALLMAERELPPLEVELALNKETGDIFVRVDRQHIFGFQGVCGPTMGL